MNFQSGKLSTQELREGGHHICRLVCGKAQSFLAEFSSTLDNHMWPRTISSSYPADLASGLISLFVLLNCHHAAAYHRRVYAPLQEIQP
jgi:hypothetical protein